MREDIMSPQEIEEILELEAAIHDADSLKDIGALESARNALHDWLVEHAPRRALSSVRENVEILAVAIAVAMACRTYFIQPFKIPTGSMQPTLFGIQYETMATPGFMNKPPLNSITWLVYGAWHKVMRAKESGHLTYDRTAQSPDVLSFYIGSRRYDIPKDGATGLTQYITKGTVLWQGLKIAGDHVFVNKVKWNFQRPKRGQIMVFNTDNIEGLPPKTHYIKRMVGMPGETVSIDPPYLMIDGEAHLETEPIRRITEKENGYLGYQLVSLRTSDPRKHQMRTTRDKLKLGEREYCAMGDNTGNSRDSRYWGAVPEDNLVGPAFAIYWPFSARWGFAK